eukprot:8712805-Pyramimonas_sp.AAC.1
MPRAFSASPKTEEERTGGRGEGEGWSTREISRRGLGTDSAWQNQTGRWGGQSLAGQSGRRAQAALSGRRAVEAW